MFTTQIWTDNENH